MAPYNKKDWKCGDVAMVTAANVRTEYRAYFNGEYWIEHGHGSGILVNPATIRRLLVIDPESSEDVARLARCLDNRIVDETEMLQDALRTFAKEKPEEPRGLGAVVEDIDGLLWVLVDTRPNVAGWRRVNVSHSRPWRFYADIDVVRVLSEGVVSG